MGSCNDHDVLDNSSSIITYQGAIKNIVIIDDDNVKLILYDKFTIIAPRYNSKLIKNERSSFIFNRDVKTGQNTLIDVLPPKIFKFYASVAGIFNIINETPTHDTIKLKNGGNIDLMRYEIIFIEGTPNKRVYVRDDYLNNIDIGGYYMFECVIDNEDRNYWFRVISAYTIENNDDDSEIESDAKIVYERYYKSSSQI